VLLALGGVALYVLLPSLLAVFDSWRSLSHLDLPYAVLVLLAEVASFVCLWELGRIALDRADTADDAALEVDSVDL